MDPLTHTLVGLSLAETRLKHTTPLARTTMILGANLPDVDVVAHLISLDVALGFRRGLTHGVLAMIVLPWLLTGGILLFDRFTRRQHLPDVPPAKFDALLRLAYIAVLTHPFLDWLNTYGVRLLMPFDNRWFYGDSVFIVDPWFWLLSGTAAVLCNTKSRLSTVSWILLGTILTLVVTRAAIVPMLGKVLWCFGVSLIASLRIWGGLQHQMNRVATFALTAAVLYAVTMFAITQLTRWSVEHWLKTRGLSPQQIMASPVPVNPFVRDVIVSSAGQYHFLRVNWLASETIRINGRSISRKEPDSLVEAALQAPHVQGLRVWMRLPSYQVEELSDGYKVTIRDIRYSRNNATGIGTEIVELDRYLNIR